jgi:hypothetical protein
MGYSSGNEPEKWHMGWLFIGTLQNRRRLSANEQGECPISDTPPCVMPSCPLGTLFAFLSTTILKTEHEKEYFTRRLFFDAADCIGTK